VKMIVAARTSTTSCRYRAVDYRGSSVRIIGSGSGGGARASALGMDAKFELSSTSRMQVLP
jgi:uncharacterized protein (DUF1786 family)